MTTMAGDYQTKTNSKECTPGKLLEKLSVNRRKNDLLLKNAGYLARLLTLAPMTIENKQSYPRVAAAAVVARMATRPA